jgi:serine/threonine-protein kinase
MVWVDREGREEDLDIERKTWLSARLSPDNQQILLNTNYPPYTVYLYDLNRRTLRPQTFEGRTHWAIWGPQESEFTFDSDFEGPQGIYINSVDSGLEAGEKLETGFVGYHKPSSWTPDRAQLAFVNEASELDGDLWLIDKQGNRESFLETRFNEKYPEFSPDGNWLAYVSDQSGRNEVYVRPFPGPGTPVQVSTEGGWEPCWSSDQREIFFSLITGPDQLTYFSVQIAIEDGQFHPGLPEKLFEGAFALAIPVRSYDLGPDERFLLRKVDPDIDERILQAMAPNRIELVQNWFEELRAKVPVE